MPTPNDYTYFSQQTLSDVFGYFETQEGFNESGQLGAGRLYLDTGALSAPTIGHGFVALQVKPDKTPEPERETFTA